MSAGKVDLGAFRTYPKGYKAPDAEPSEYQTIPVHKIEDFGVHANEYYKLDVSYFKSSLDDRLLSTMWNTYWVNTLATSTILNNRLYMTAQMGDVAEKLQQVRVHLFAHIH
jgi:COP9 signalosome complex subunit 5